MITATEPLRAAACPGLSILEFADDVDSSSIIAAV